MKTLEVAGHELHQHLKGLGVEAMVGLADTVLFVYVVKRLKTPVLTNLERDGWEGFPVTVKYTGRPILAGKGVYAVHSQVRGEEG